jgi:alpha-1,3-rhamnosyltransferase
MSDITVLVPSYNHAEFVERTLRSIFRQTVSPKLLIVIDDGSVDESVEVIRHVLNDCPIEHRFIHRENRGLCATLNESLLTAVGKYFAYISSDDVWLPEFLESRSNLLDSRPSAVLAYGHSFLIDEQDRIIDSTANWSDYTDGRATAMLLHPIIPASASVLYRRDTLEKFRWNESSILEDYELYLRLSNAGEFALDDKVLSAWRIHERNTSSDFPRMVDEWLAAQNRVAEEIGIGNEELAGIQKSVQFNCISSYIRHGHKATAARLLWKNAADAPLGTTAGLIFRLMIPAPLLKWRRKIVKERMIRKYGRLDHC